jgi:hypothetical protein
VTAVRVVVVVLGLAIASGAAAQEQVEAPAPVGLDSRVRIDFVREIPGRQAPIRRDYRATGTVTALDAGRITLRREGELPVSIPLMSVEKLGLSLGRSRTQGAIRGLAWGLVVGCATALLVDSWDNPTTQNPDGRLSNSEVALIVGVGMAAGTAIGYGVGTEHWHDVPVGGLWQDPGN